MNSNLLIDAVVRQTTVLIAHLATAAGSRTPLSHLAPQVFVDLVTELKSQGLGHKVIADMFGLGLRTYHHRVRRFGASATRSGRSLWSAILDFVQQAGAVTRAEILARFCDDDEETVRGLLADLTDSGLLYRSGRGDATTFRAAAPDEVGRGAGDAPEDAAANLVWVAVKRGSPATRAEVEQALGLDAEALDAALRRLLADGRITAAAAGGETVYECREFVFPVGRPGGWEASVFDHYQAMVTALCVRLRGGARAAHAKDATGGSTYSFEVWQEHPLRERVVGLLARQRHEVAALRAEVEAWNVTQGSLPADVERVIFYMGQVLLAEDQDERREK